jgi:putative acetyltransferase
MGLVERLGRGRGGLSTIGLRPARESDLDAIRALQRAAILAIGSDSYSPVETRAWADWQAADARALLTGGGTVLVGENETGLACMGAWRPDAANETVAWIRSVFVSPRAARRGYGQQVMAALERSCADAGGLNLNLFASFNARPFYEKLGYRLVSTETWTVTAGMELGSLRMTKGLR